MTKITYEVVEHDGGWAYQVDGVFSETFPSHDLARKAADRAAPRLRQANGAASSAMISKLMSALTLSTHARRAMCIRSISSRARHMRSMLTRPAAGKIVLRLR